MNAVNINKVLYFFLKINSVFCNSAGWNMTGDQGDIFWRAAFVNLEKFNKVYQIRFVHTLPEGNCHQRSPKCTVCKYQKCPAANLAIDGIELVCQGENKNVPVEVCKKRTAVLAGCEMEAVMASVTGKKSVKH